MRTLFYAIYGVYLLNNGVNVIPSIRWGDKYSWNFCFEGIKKHSLLALGTLSALGTCEDRENFHKGFLKMIKSLEPYSLLIYGKLPEEEIFLCHENRIFYREYPTELSKAVRKKVIGQDELDFPA